MQLDRYCILDCEPLHDLKGHLANLFTELPYIIMDAQLRRYVKDLLGVVVPKEKPSGGDYRRAMIQLLALLKERAERNVVQTIVEISETEILYSNDNKHNNVTILRLHNLTWLHHELCKDLFQSLHTLSREKIFGLYLHAISCHASKQYELMCAKSCNTENEERLFGQAKAIALSTINRRPGNILPNILLRLQAKQQVKELFKEQRSQSNKISAEARAVHTPTNTKVPLEFVSRRLDSWQLHLEEISCYLVEGEGVWWKTCESEGVTFEFLNTENSHEDPKPQHYRAANFFQLKQQKQNAWEKIINSDTTLPTSGIELYDNDGNFLSTKTFAPYMTMFSTEYGLETNTDTTPTAQEESIEPTDMPQHNDDEMHTDSASIDEPVPKDTVSDN